jgi:hypothetical protein
MAPGQALKDPVYGRRPVDSLHQDFAVDLSVCLGGHGDSRALAIRPQRMSRLRPKASIMPKLPVSPPLART